MGTDQIGSETPGLELLGSTGTALCANDLGFSFHHQRMNTLGVAAIEAVTEVVEALGNATRLFKGIDAQGHQLVLTLLGQALNDVDVLARKVLMNKENAHRLRDAVAIPPCPGTHPEAAAGRRPCAA